MRLLSVTAGFIACVAAVDDLSQHVDVFYGTEGGGNMFPGVVAAPFASVKLGPDGDNGNQDAYSGYLPQGKVTGFSLLHESGTGGAPKYGVVSQMPVLGRVDDPLAESARSRARPDEGSVGYYKTSLEDGITVELAGTDHAGFYRYSFPSGAESSVIVDLSHFLKSFRGTGWSQAYTNGSITLAEDGHYEGTGVYRGGWNLSPDWAIHFCGYFNQKPASARTFVERSMGSNASMVENESSVQGTSRLGAIFGFNTSVVQSRVGVSFVSRQRACSYVNTEIPEGTSLETLVSRSKTRWNTEVFEKVMTTDNNTTLSSRLYTNLYGMHLLPSNRTGDNPGWDSLEPYYDDIFTFWDLFRCTTPLYHILQPKMYEGLIRSLIDVWRHEGYMPDGRSSNYNGRSQGGSNADNVLADAYVKGLRGAVNWTAGYAAMRKDSKVTPPPNNDQRALDSSTKEGRGALPDWLGLGWISPTFTRAVGRAMEYSVNDFALSAVAEGLGFAEDAKEYRRRSQNWRNHFNPEARSHNISGAVVPRTADGEFVKQDPASCGGCYWGDAYYQATPFEYTLNAHHDLAWLIKKDGGAADFTRRLDTLLVPENKLYDPGNEPSFATPYLYNFVNKQDLSVQHSRSVAMRHFKTGVNGLPGNSDAGAMQSWILWQMFGLYPLTGQTTYLIGSPWFKNLTLDLGEGKSLRMTASGPEGAIYVKSVLVNGIAWSKNWLTHEDIFATGGTMDFQLSEQSTGWNNEGEYPPSPASYARTARVFGGVDTYDEVELAWWDTAGYENEFNNRQKVALVAIILSSIGVVGLTCTLLFSKRRKILRTRRFISAKGLTEGLVVVPSSE